MKILFRGQNLGSKFDFIASLDSDKIEKTNSVLLGETDFCLEIPSKKYKDLCKLYNLEYRKFPPQKFINAYEILLKDKIEYYQLPWQFILPKETYKIEVRHFINSILNDLRGVNLNYYLNVFEKQNIVLENLEEAAIDLVKFESFMQTNEEPATKTFLKSFNPRTIHNGVWYCNIPSYDRFGTVTGRLKIENGPNILHLKKEYRKVLKSRWGINGDIFYLDFKSLEPRVLLALKDKNISIPKDIYTYMVKQMGLEGQVDRNHIKTAIISMIYGAGDKELKKQLSAHVSYPDDFIKSVKEQFGVDTLREDLREKYENNKSLFITNLYDRPIFTSGVAPYVLVNYFIQSTAADVALFGFSKIVGRLINTKTNEFIKPILLLHDALILDVHKDAQFILPKLAKLGGEKIPKFENMRFWIEIEKL